MHDLAAVVIGRNEGERFLRCLASLRGQVGRVVYVDSGSSDGSVAAARAAGALVVELARDAPFTAARARNAGFAALGAEVPEFVQFLDGDCEMRAEWLGAALGVLRDHPEVAVVCGRRRERFPEVSVYNRLCDREWDTPVGEALACGGDALIRAQAFAAVGGYDPGLIAGEEPEMCARLRGQGWRIWRIGVEMVLHDAAMLRFGQWWKRARRGGFAAAQGAMMHGGGRDQVRRAVAWGAGLPLVILAGMSVTPWAAVLALAWPLQVARLALRLARETGASRFARETWEWPVFMTLGKFPEVLGVAEFWLGRALGRRPGIIEYK
ncbi:glycosyltransferase family 2 protein [Stagnihabitans tardus]|uniref:Glycosyltransferase n=1 Tax=Stagnihabitans tardus TaxID=2699202 RepID=A0AAE4YHJ0_9RHOB|nr:glycosyltransferase [Stagnihabitans tardus]NBZ90040.1 glycosyltransferase [Stagnihabitans tardus]